MKREIMKKNNLNGQLTYTKYCYKNSIIVLSFVMILLLINFTFYILFNT